MSVTRDASASHSYYGLTRSGQMVYGIGIDTSNRLWIGVPTPGHLGVLSSPYVYIHAGGMSVAGGLGVNGVNPAARATVPGAAFDEASAISLVNSLRTALINCGICQ